jgi:hypothetical protein
MGWAGHVTSKRRKEFIRDFEWGKMRQRESLEDPDVDKLLLLKWNFRKWDGIDRARNRDGWWTLLNAVIKLRVPYNAGNFLTG